MRPVGVSLIAALTWCMGAFWALVGFGVIGFSRIGAHLLSAITEGSFSGAFHEFCWWPSTIWWWDLD
jgi:hypothetical protein